MNFMKRLLIVLSMCLIPIAHSQPITAKPGLEIFSEKLNLFETKLQALIKKHKLPGLAVAVVKDKKLAWSKGYGFADEDKLVAITPDTPFWIASVTKPFIGLLFLQLESEGTIDLNDRINDVPGWSDFCAWLASSKLPFGSDLRCNDPITVRNILNHTSNGQPGTRFLYNPILYSRLSRYLEHKLGRSVEEVEGRHNSMAQFVESKILKPAEMNRTMASQWQREKNLVYFDMAEGFGVEGEYFIKRPRPNRELAGGAGIVSTAEDLARFDIALDAGTLASPEIVRKMFTPTKTNEGKVLPYAFGWYVQNFENQTVYWHSGWDDAAGFSAIYMKVPDRNLSLILLANGEGLWWNNPLDQAMLEKSEFADVFMKLLVLTP